MAQGRKKLKSISRIDQPEKHTFGWYVRVRYLGKDHVRFHPDRKFGGKSKALLAAIAFRNEVEVSIGKPRTDRMVVVRRKRANRPVGVRYIVKKTQLVSGEVRETPVYEVTWNPAPQKTSRTSVSIQKHGKKEAFRLAVAMRKSKEEEIASPPSRTGRAKPAKKKK